MWASAGFASVVAFDGGAENALDRVVEQAVVAALGFAKHGFSVLALGDVLNETFEGDGSSLDIEDAGTAFPHPTDAAVRVDDAVFEVERTEFSHGAPDRFPHPEPVVREGQVVVGDALTQQDVGRLVSCDAQATLADKLHGPVGVQTAAVHHAVHVGQ